MLVCHTQDGKELAVDENFVCTSYCPTEDYWSPYNVDGFSDMGPAVIDGASLEWWQDVEKIPILNITMEADNIYVNQSGPFAIPVLEVSLRTRCMWSMFVVAPAPI